MLILLLNLSSSILIALFFPISNKNHVRDPLHPRAPLPSACASVFLTFGSNSYKMRSSHPRCAAVPCPPCLARSLLNHSSHRQPQPSRPRELDSAETTLPNSSTSETLSALCNFRSLGRHLAAAWVVARFLGLRCSARYRYTSSEPAPPRAQQNKYKTS